MELQLEVLSSCQIKRKAPAPKLRWIGCNKESLVILDGKKTRALYLPSGKTKKKKSGEPLPALLQDAIFVDSFCDGLVVGIVHKAGDISLYWSETGQIEKIAWLSDFTSAFNHSRDAPVLFVGNQGKHVVLIYDLNEIFVWDREEDGKANGVWHKVRWGYDLPMPDVDENPEVIVTTQFYQHEFLGACTLVTYSFLSDGILYFPTAVIRWERNKLGLPRLFTSWCCPHFTNPLGVGPQMCKGSLVASYCPTTALLAVGVNGPRPAQAVLLYIDPLASVVVSRPLLGLGVAESHKPKSSESWLLALSWDPAGAYVLGSTGLGLLLVAPRLGSPCLLRTSGCCLDMGPASFLPILPQQSASIRGNPKPAPRLSLTIHPRHPVFLFCDGVQVVVFRLPVGSPRTGVVQAHLATVYDTLVEMDQDMRQFGPAQELNACQEFSSEQMARVAQWTANLGNPAGGSAWDVGPSEDSEDSDNSGTADIDWRGSVGSLSGVGGPVQYSSRSSRLNEGSPKVQAATPEYNSDSGLHSLHGEENDRDWWMKKSRHYLIGAFGFLLTDPSTKEGFGSVNSDDLCDNILEGWYRTILTLLTTSLTETGPNEEVLAYVLEGIGGLLSEIFSLLAFDAIQQRFFGPVQRFVQETINLIIHGDAFRARLPLTHCLQLGCKTAERAAVVLQEMYSWRCLDCGGSGGGSKWWPRRLASALYPVAKESAQPGLQSSSRIKGMLPIWQSLDKFATAIIDHSGDVIGVSFKRCHAGIRRHITASTISPSDPVPAFSRAEQFLLEGKDKEAMEEWKEIVQKLGQQGCYLYSKTVSRVLHSILYLIILRGDLRAALNLVAGVANLVQGQDTEDCAFLEAFSSQLNDRWFLFVCRRSAVVRSMGRFMAAYFTNSPLFIFPPHTPRPVPTIPWMSDIEGIRRIVLLPTTITSLIIDSRNEEFSVERCMELLLLGGLLAEATWMANQLGDWRTATVLGWATNLAKQEETATGRKLLIKANLPPDLKPNQVLMKHAKSVVDKLVSSDKCEPCDEEICLGFRDLLTAACIARIPLLEPLLDHLVHNDLVQLISTLPLFVHEDVYLPAPPVFCPQPSSDKRQSVVAAKEVNTRASIFRLVDATMTLLRAAFTALPCAGWYASQLIDAERKALGAEYKLPREGRDLESVFADYLPLSERFSDSENVGPVRRLLAAYRDFCSLMWFLHVRDKMSLLTRQRVRNVGTDEETWLKSTTECLEWCLHLMPFTPLLQSEASQLHLYLLTLLNEFEPEPEIAHLLVEWDFHLDNQSLSVEVTEKLRRMLKSWQKYMADPEKTVFVKSRRKRFLGKCLRGESLSVHYHSRLEAGKVELSKRKETFGLVEQYLFHPQTSGESVEPRFCIGSRPFETEDSYLDFLDMLFSVGFARAVDHLDKSHDQNDVPLLIGFDDLIAEREFTSASYMASVSALNSPRSPRPPLPSPRHSVRSVEDEPPIPSPRPRSGSYQSSKGAPQTQDRKSAGRNSIASRYRSPSLERINVAGTGKGVGMIRSSSSGALNGEPVPRLNFANVANGGSACPTPRSRRSSLSEYRGRTQSENQQALFTPRSESVGYKTAPYITEIEVGLDKQSLYDRVNWLVRWTYRHGSSQFAPSPVQSSGNQHSAMRIRINTNLLVYTVFGVERPRKMRRVERRSQGESSPSSVQLRRRNEPQRVEVPMEDGDSRQQESLHLELERLNNIVGSRRRKKREDVQDNAPESAASLHNESHPGLPKSCLKRQPSDESLLSMLSDESNLSIVSHSDKIRAIARQKLAGFVEEAKNGRGPSGERSVVPDSNLIQHLEMDQGNLARQSNNNSIPVPAVDKEASEESTTLDVSSLTGFGNVFGNGTVIPNAGHRQALQASAPNSGVRLPAPSTQQPRPLRSSEGLSQPPYPHQQRPSSSRRPTEPIRRQDSSQFRSGSEKTTAKRQEDRSPRGAMSRGTIDSSGQLAQQLQSVLRGEMRKILQVQQASVLAVLNAMDDEGRTSHSLHLTDLEGTNSARRSTGENSPRKPRQQVQSSRSQPHTSHRGLASNRSEDLTDVTLTDMFTEHTDVGHPSRRSSGRQHGSSQKKKRGSARRREETTVENGSGMFGESVDLTGQQIGGRSQRHRQSDGLGSALVELDWLQRQEATRTRHRAPPSYGKENRGGGRHPPLLSAVPNQFPQFQAPQQPASVPFPLLTLPVHDPMIRLVSNGGLSCGGDHRATREDSVLHGVPLLRIGGSTRRDHQGPNIVGFHEPRNPVPRLLPPELLLNQFQQTSDHLTSKFRPILEFNKEVEMRRRERFGRQLLHADVKPDAPRERVRASTPRSARVSSEADTLKSTSMPSSPRKSHGSPHRQTNRGTMPHADTGVQHDALSDDEDVHIHHGYAVLPGFLREEGSAGRVTSRYSPRDAHIMTTPRFLDDAGTMTRRSYENVGLHLGAPPVLPPDIVGNLRLGGTQGGARKFLSVVSVDDKIWDEVVGHNIPHLDEASAIGLGSPGRSSSRLDSSRRSAEKQPMTGPDAVTQALLNQSIEGDEIGQGEGRTKARVEVIRTLHDMDHRLRVIDQMAAKMDRDFVQSRQLVSTITGLEEPVDYTEDRHRNKKTVRLEDNPPRSEQSSPKHQPRTNIPERSPPHEYSNGLEGPETGRSVASITTQDMYVESASLIGARISSRDHQLSERKTPRSHSSSPDRHVVNLADVQNLDDFSRNMYGGSPRRQSPQRTRPSSAGAAGHLCHMGRRPEEERRELHAWMAQKRAERREKQQGPGGSTGPASGVRRGSTGSLGGVSGLTMDERERMRRQREMENAEKRKAQARRLVGEVMSESGVPSQSHQVPVQPQLGPSALEMMSARMRTEQRNARKKAAASQRPGADDFEFNTYEDYDAYLDKMMELSSAATTEILSSARGSDAPQQAHMVPYQQSKPRPYTAMVKVQRPEITRKAPAHGPLSKAELMASLNSSTPTMIPAPSPQGTGRQVKPYSERSSARSGLGARGRGSPARGGANAQRFQQTKPSLPGRATYKLPISRRDTRARPYSPPYVTQRSLDDEGTSILSEWSVESNVKRILYGPGSDKANMQPYDDVSMPSRASDLLDAASLHSESVVSYIDWDQLDQIIKSP